MLIRLAAGGLFTAAGGLAGAAKSWELRYRLKQCREVGELLRRCSFLIRSSAPDVYQLSRELVDDGGFATLTFLLQLPTEYSPEVRFSVQWCSAVSGQLSLGDEERSLLCRFGMILGASDIPGQLSSIDVLLEEQERMESRREEELRRLGRLWKSVGTLLGVMAGILII